jgi:P27 family predicted phage terminase small subunit
VSNAQKPPKAPAGLRKAGAALWARVLADVHADWELDSSDLHGLEQAARAVDRAQELGEVIDRDGLMIAGSTGQERLHPAVAEQRMQRQLSAHLVSKIALAPPDAKTGHLSGKQRQKLRAVGR